MYLPGMYLYLGILILSHIIYLVQAVSFCVASVMQWLASRILNPAAGFRSQLAATVGWMLQRY